MPRQEDGRVVGKVTVAPVHARQAFVGPFTAHGLLRSVVDCGIIIKEGTDRFANRARVRIVSEWMMDDDHAGSFTTY